MTNRSIMTRIATAACNAELKHSRMLGLGWFASYNSSMTVLDEIEDIWLAPMPADVLTRFRPMHFSRETT